LETNLFTAVDAKFAVTGICKQVSGTNTWHGRQDFAAAGGVVGSCILAVAFFFFLSLFRISCLVSLSTLTYLLSPGSLLLHSFASSSSSSSKKQQKRSQKLKGFGLIAVSSHFRLLSD
jgi:hypothetical protein